MLKTSNALNTNASIVSIRMRHAPIASRRYNYELSSLFKGWIIAYPLLSSARRLISYKRDDVPPGEKSKITYN